MIVIDDRTRSLTRETLLQDEGSRSFPYVDSVGKITIGVGHNLTDNGISKNIIDQLLDEDIDQAIRDAVEIFGQRKIYTWTIYQRAAIFNMLFNLGKFRFLKFARMIRAIRSGDWTTAAREAKNSIWYKQVKSRGPRVCALMLNQDLYRGRD